MPGSPPTSPNFNIPRYADGDTASFSAQVNAVTDVLDALAARNDHVVYRLQAKSAAYTAAGGDWVLMTGNQPVTLPPAPPDGLLVGVSALTANVNVLGNGSSIVDGLGNSTTYLVVHAGGTTELRSLGGVWHATRQTFGRGSRAYCNAGQMLFGANAWTTVPLFGIDYDPGSNFSGGQWICPATGEYEFEAGLTILANQNPQLFMAALFRNGVQWRVGSSIEPRNVGADTDVWSSMLSDRGVLNMGDTISLRGFNGNVANNVSVWQFNQPAYNFMGVRRVS